MKIKSEFWINVAKFQALSDKAVDWTIKSWKYKVGSPEYKICKLKREIYMRDALEFLDEAGKELR